MSNSSKNDIPPARRQPTEISLAEIERIGLPAKPRRRRGKGLFVCLFLLAIAGVGAWQWKTVSAYVTPAAEGAKESLAKGKSAVSAAIADARTESAEGRREPAVPAASSRQTETGTNPSVAADTSGAKPDELLNHRRYDVVPEDGLVTLNPNSPIRLQPAAQAAVTEMIEKARSEGVRLGLVSGFRTLEDQNYLYFEVKAERGESAATRAEVSAPPGYSEHHTGYAVDFIDESKPSTHVEKSFETTPAFKWLQKNAAFYNFELSFPDDPASPVGYEPWHWRYVGNQESLELFYKEAE